MGIGGRVEREEVQIVQSTQRESRETSNHPGEPDLPEDHVKKKGGGRVETGDHKEKSGKKSLPSSNGGRSTNDSPGPPQGPKGGGFPVFSVIVRTCYYRRLFEGQVWMD